MTKEKKTRTAEGRLKEAFGKTWFASKDGVKELSEECAKWMFEVIELAKQEGREEALAIIAKGEGWEESEEHYRKILSLNHRPAEEE